MNNISFMHKCQCAQTIVNRSGQLWFIQGRWTSHQLIQIIFHKLNNQTNLIQIKFFFLFQSFCNFFIKCKWNLRWFHFMAVFRFFCTARWRTSTGGFKSLGDGDNVIEFWYKHALTIFKLILQSRYIWLFRPLLK